jgi:hypothetical protein
MNFQTKLVPELSQDRLQGTRLQTKSQNLSVEREKHKVHSLVLDRYVTQKPDLRLELRQNVQDKRWDASHELLIVFLPREAVDAGPHSGLYKLVVTVQDSYIADPRVKGEQLVR